MEMVPSVQLLCELAPEGWPVSWGPTDEWTLVCKPAGVDRLQASSQDGPSDKCVCIQAKCEVHFLLSLACQSFWFYLPSNESKIYMLL